MRKVVLFRAREFMIQIKFVINLDVSVVKKKTAGQSLPLPGRRIVEIDIMAKRMYCDKCSDKLHFDQFESETLHGLGSVLTLRCACGAKNDVPTGKTHDSTSGHSIFDVNSKAAIAMVHVGAGPTHISEFFGVLNIPPPSFKTIKKGEREV